MKNISVNARSAVEKKFDWDKVTADTLKAYFELIKDYRKERNYDGYGIQYSDSRVQRGEISR